MGPGATQAPSSLLDRDGYWEWGPDLMPQLQQLLALGVDLYAEGPQLRHDHGKGLGIVIRGDQQWDDLRVGAHDYQ